MVSSFTPCTSVPVPAFQTAIHIQRLPSSSHATSSWGASFSGTRTARNLHRRVVSTPTIRKPNVIGVAMQHTNFDISDHTTAAVAAAALKNQSSAQQNITGPLPLPQIQALKHSMTNPAATRRAFLQHALSVCGRLTLASIAATAVGTLPLSSPAPAYGYSSPYRPSRSDNDPPLPDRLYDRPAASIVHTPSGLEYFDLRVGAGKPASVGSIVSVSYTSRLRGLNGIKIQSSFDDPSSPPFVFRVGDVNVVPGVSEALVGMREGGFRRTVLPPNIAYSSPDMLPKVTEFFARRRLLSVLETNRDSTIVFDLELLKVKD